MNNNFVKILRWEVITATETEHGEEDQFYKKNNKQERDYILRNTINYQK